MKILTKPGSRILCTAAIILFIFSPTGRAATVTVEVFNAFYEPFSVTINPGDTVTWHWNTPEHSVTSGTPGSPDGLFDSGIKSSGSFSFTFRNEGLYNYYCIPHGFMGMIGSVHVESTSTPTPTPTATPTPNLDAQPLNISTRMEVLTDARVLIGGFIITGNDPKKVILRAIGPSLAGFGISNPLADPVLELHGPDGALLTMNDNWKDTQESAIEASGFMPSKDFESAIISTLNPGNYTAIVSGKNGGTGVGLVEGYDLDPTADSQFGNISTRGFIETGSNVMIGGFILGGGGGNVSVLVRALGPSLTQFGVTGALADPILELRDENGALIQSNDNWKDSQQTAIEMTGLEPSKDLESAVLSTLGPGAYTAIVAGEGDLTGVGLVEVYRLSP